MMFLFCLIDKIFFKYILNLFFNLAASVTIVLCSYHIFDCPTIVRTLLCLRELFFTGELCSNKIIEIAKKVTSDHASL